MFRCKLYFTIYITTVFYSKFSLVAEIQTLDNSCNIDKSNMAASHLRENATLKPVLLE